MYSCSLAQGSPYLNSPSGCDICFDSYGRGYLLTSGNQLYNIAIDETANTALLTYIANLSALSFTPTSMAFNPNFPHTHTISGYNGYSMANYDLSTNTLTSIPNASTWAVWDLTSSFYTSQNPVLKVTKTMYDSTQRMGPPVAVATGGIIQYTITVTNTGNLNAGAFTIADAIPQVQPINQEPLL